MSPLAKNQQKMKQCRRTCSEDPKSPPHSREDDVRTANRVAVLRAARNRTLSRQRVWVVVPPVWSHLDAAINFVLHEVTGGTVPSVAPVDRVLPAITAELEGFSASFEWLVSVDTESLFTQRASLVRIAWNAIPRTSRGWTLFLSLPRLLLHRPPRKGGKIPIQLQCRTEGFFIVGQCSGEHITQAFSHRRRVIRVDLESRGSPGRGVHMWELSSATSAESVEATTCFTRPSP